jgi:hypothetical protein
MTLPKVCKINKHLIDIRFINTKKYPERSHFMLTFADGTRLQVLATEWVNQSDYTGELVWV